MSHDALVARFPWGSVEQMREAYLAEALRCDRVAAVAEGRSREVAWRQASHARRVAGSLLPAQRGLL